MRSLPSSLILGMLFVALPACGGGDSEEAAPTDAPSAAPAPEPAPEPAASFNASNQASEASDEDIAAYCAETLAMKGGPGLVID